MSHPEKLSTDWDHVDHQELRKKRDNDHRDPITELIKAGIVRDGEYTERENRKQNPRQEDQRIVERRRTGQRDAVSQNRERVVGTCVRQNSSWRREQHSRTRAGIWTTLKRQTCAAYSNHICTHRRSR